jgi:carbon monoxide dehydrogenase subunit G
MKMSGEEFIPAPRDAVWKALNDTEVLKRCIPGCESITRHSPTQMSAKVTVKLGPVKASFGGDVTLSNIDAPNSYRISGKGNGIAGVASGGADVMLADAEGGTKLSYDVDAQVGGKLAMLGGRLIDSTSRQLAGQFFEKFAAEAAALAQGARPAPARKPAAKKPATKKPAAKKPAGKKPAGKKPAKKVSAKKPAGKPAKKKR